MSGEGAGYIPSLDGIRALAVALVFFSHVGYGDVVPGGFGVTVFFFLSGYLITTLMLREYFRSGGVSIKMFYLRRALRILPPMYVVYFSVVILALLGVYPAEINFWGVILQSLHLTNYASIFGVPVLDGTGVLWSLAVEEHFYLVFPFVAIFFIGSIRGFIFFVFLFCVASLLWRVVAFFILENPSDWIGIASDTRMDSIAWGVLFALLVWGRKGLGDKDNKILCISLFWASLAFICITFLVRDQFFRDTFRYSLQGALLIPVFYCIIYCNGFWVSSLLSAPAVRRIGVLSYSIYLVHAPVIVVLKGLGVDGFGLVFLALAITFFFSDVVYRAVDVPVSRFRRRIGV